MVVVMHSNMARPQPQTTRPQWQGRVLPFPRPELSPARGQAVVWLDRGIFGCLCVLAAVTIENAFVARWAFYAALVLWAARLLVRRNFRPQPLVAPLLAFLILLGVATSLSYAPLLSWDRMSWFVLLLLSVIAAQNITSIKQAKILTTLVLLGGALSATLTGWQYLYGIGTRLPIVPPGTALYADGIRSGDLVQAINRHHTRSLGEWTRTLEQTREDPVLQLHMARGTPIQYFDVSIPRSDLDGWLAMPGMKVARGGPIRAQGHLYHYVPYAGELLQVAMLAFGLLLAGARQTGKRVLLALLLLGLAAALVATVTRTYLAALLVSSLFVFWLTHKRVRLPAAMAFACVLLAATAFVYKERGYGWLAPHDAGTEYREQMWKDSVHIIPHHLLFGVGPDSVLQFGDQWNVVAYRMFPLRSHFHSTYIQLAVDCGLPCLAAWCWLMTAYVVFLWRTWKLAAHWDWFARGLLLGVFGATVGFLLASFVHYTLGDGEVMILVWLYMGMIVAVARLAPERSSFGANV